MINPPNPLEDLLEVTRKVKEASEMLRKDLENPDDDSSPPFSFSTSNPSPPTTDLSPPPARESLNKAMAEFMYKTLEIMNKNGNEIKLQKERQEIEKAKGGKEEEKEAPHELCNVVMMEVRVLSSRF